MRIYKILMILMLICTLTACEPSYEVQSLESPDMETLPESAPYNFDFLQINNDVIDYYSQDDIRKIFPFIKNLEIDGSNEDRNIKLILDVQPNVSKEAIDILLSDITKQIGNAAQVQDFRLQAASSDSFGTVFDIYSYTIKVTQADNSIYDQTIESDKGENIPFEASIDGTTIKQSIEAAIEEKASDAETSKEIESSSNSN